MVFLNPFATWASAPQLVPKPGPRKFRFTVNLQPVNRFSVKHQFPISNIEHEIGKLLTSRFFALFGLSHGYWQLLLPKSSQKCQSFITSDSIYLLTRVLQETRNAIMDLHLTLAAYLPDKLRPNILWWLDDNLDNSKTATDSCNSISLLFWFCTEYNFNLHPGKCTRFATSIRRCGRLISAEGISFDLKRICRIQQITCPEIGVELQQAVCAMQWMRAAIQQFFLIICPLADLPKTCYAHVGKHTCFVPGLVSLSPVGCRSEHSDTFNCCKLSLEHQVTLSHVDTEKRLCNYT